MARLRSPSPAAAEPTLDDPAAVVVVEDDDDYRELLTHALQQHCGVGRVLAYADGASAIAALAATSPERQPALLLLDFHMPGLSGLDVLQRLSALHYAGRRAVISSAASPGDRAACEAQGAVFLSKPSRFDDLLAALTALVAGTRELR